MVNCPAISVVMPVYNGKRYLREAIESILGQTEKDLELIVVDDGSTDGSVQILRSYEARDARVRAISRPNTGIAGARNDGLAAARAALVASADADDVSLPMRLELQAAYMNAHPECVLVGAGAVIVDPEGREICAEHYPSAHEEIDRELMAGNGAAIRQPVAMLRREAVVRVGGYQSIYSGTEDLDLFLRLAEIGRVANLAEPLIYYRQHFASCNRTRWREQDQHRHMIVTEAHLRRGQSIDKLQLAPYAMPGPAEQYLRWGWRVLVQGRKRDAGQYAMASLRRNPLRREAWKLLACSIRGY